MTHYDNIGTRSLNQRPNMRGVVNDENAYAFELQATVIRKRGGSESGVHVPPNGDHRRDALELIHHGHAPDIPRVDDQIDALERFSGPLRQNAVSVGDHSYPHGGS